MPVDLAEEQVVAVYENFIENRQKSLNYASDKVREISKSDDMGNIILQISGIANVFKVLTEDIASEEIKDEKK